MCLESTPYHVHVHYIVSAAKEAEVPVFVRLCNSCNHITEVGRPGVLGLTLVAIMQNDEHFVAVM
jgi:hypothetical protein